MDSGSVREVIARWFPGAAIAISQPDTGVSTPVFRVGVDNGFYWARLGEKPGEHRDGEIAAHRLMSGVGLSVPELVRYEATPPELDRSIALTTHIHGVPLSTLPPAPWLEDVAAEIGRVLARINAIQVSGFGWAYASSQHGIPRGEHTSRSAWVREYREAFRTLQASRTLPEAVVRTVGVALETWASVPDNATASLAHGDLDASHLYVDPEHHTLTGIIDFGELRGADRLYDLGHFLLHDGERGRPELFPDVLRGYAEIYPLSRDAIGRIQTQAIAIGTRALSIQLERPPSPYRDWLTMRLTDLTDHREEHGDA